MPNFVKIGRSVAKTLIFQKFYWLTVSGGPRRITVPNFVKMSSSFAAYCDFLNFQDGRRRHLKFLKSRNFIGYYGPEARDASAGPILSKSVNRLQRY